MVLIRAEDAIAWIQKMIQKRRGPIDELTEHYESFANKLLFYILYILGLLF
jgi:hypothetical protein